MALVIQDTTYSGEVASSFIVKAAIGNEIVQGGHVMVKDGIKKKFTIPRMTVSDDFIQDRVPTPVSGNAGTGQGTITVDARVLEPNDYMIYQEFNPRDFEDHWEAVNLNPTLIDRRLPVTVESVILQEVMKKHNQWLGGAIMRGDTNLTTNLKYFNGLITRAIADSDVPKVASPVILTVSNIEAQLEASLATVPAAVLYDPNLKVFVSYKTAQLWERAQRAAGFKGIDNTMAGLMRFAGRQMVYLYGMPDNTIFWAKGAPDMTSNLWFGLNSKDDATVQIAKLQANSELYFIKMLCKADTNYGYGAETALYTL